MEGRRSLTCGCGFSVQGFDTHTMERMFDDHRCLEPETPGTWHEALFSPWGWAVTSAAVILVMVIMSGVVAMVTGQSFWGR